MSTPTFTKPATMETFVRGALAEFGQAPQGPWLIGCWLLVVACNLASAYLTGKISSAAGTPDWTMAVSLAASLYATSRARRQIHRLDIELARHVGDKLQTAHLELYARLDRAAKDKNPVGPYDQLSAGMRSSTIQLMSMVSDFFGEFVGSLSAFIMGIAMSPSHGGAIYALAAAVCAATVVAAGRINAESTALLKAREAAETLARSAGRIALQQFQIDARAAVADVVAESSAAKRAADAHRQHQVEFATVIECASAATTAAVLACGHGVADLARAMAVIGVLNMGTHFTRAAYERFTEFSHFANFWVENAGGLDIHHAQYPLVSLEVTSVDIRLCGPDKKTFTLEGGEFSFPPGSRVLIHGEYGAGKSMFLKALMGLLRGVTLSAAGPENYTSAWTEVSQDLTAKLPWTDVTVSQLFRGAAPDAIAAAIEIAGASALLSEEGRVDPQRKLTGTLSGGQKSAAALATRLVNLLDGEHWLALDECTTGMDPRQSYATIARIFAAYRQSTMFVITHLEHAETAFEWTNILDVRDGQVTLRVKVSPPRPPAYRV